MLGNYWFFRDYCLGFGMEGLWCWIQYLELEVQGLGFRSKDFGIRVKGFGTRCWFCGFRCEGVDCRAQGGLVEHWGQGLEWRGVRGR